MKIRKEFQKRIEKRISFYVYAYGQRGQNAFLIPTADCSSKNCNQSRRRLKCSFERMAIVIKNATCCKAIYFIEQVNVHSKKNIFFFNGGWKYCDPNIPNRSLFSLAKSNKKKNYSQPTKYTRVMHSILIRFHSNMNEMHMMESQKTFQHKIQCVNYTRVYEANACKNSIHCVNNALTIQWYVSLFFFYYYSTDTSHNELVNYFTEFNVFSRAEIAFN